MTGSLMTAKDAQALAWSIHNTAADKAKAAGACWQCVAEIGSRATDKVGIDRRTENTYVIHAECSRRIERAGKG